MKIAAIEIFVVDAGLRNWIFARAETDQPGSMEAKDLGIPLWPVIGDPHARPAGQVDAVYYSAAEASFAEKAARSRAVGRTAPLDCLAALKSAERWRHEEGSIADW